MPKDNSILNEQVYDYLLDLIFTQKLAPGEKVPEKKIAEVFNISRTPVREAMRKLDNQGLIQIFPNRFAKVAEYNLEAIQGIGILRTFHDMIAVKLAFLFGSESDFIQLKKIAVDCEAAYDGNDFQNRIRLDSDFHLELAKISRNPLLIKFHKEVELRVQFIILNYPNTVKLAKAPMSEHIAIADALINHDKNKALSLIVEHLSSFYNLYDIVPDNFFNFDLNI